MPQQTDHPTAEGSATSWTLGAGASKVSAVASNDGDTSHIHESSGTSDQSFVMPNLPSSAGSVTACTEYGIVKKQQNVGNNQIGLWSNGAPPGGLSLVSTTYTQMAASWSATTVAAVNAADSGVRGWDDSGGDNRCTELWRVTDYQLAPAGYFFIMGSLLGAASS